VVVATILVVRAEECSDWAKDGLLSLPFPLFCIFSEAERTFDGSSMMSEEIFQLKNGENQRTLSSRVRSVTMRTNRTITSSPSTSTKSTSNASLGKLYLYQDLAR